MQLRKVRAGDIDVVTIDVAATVVVIVMMRWGGHRCCRVLKYVVVLGVFVQDELSALLRKVLKLRTEGRSLTFVNILQHLVQLWHQLLELDFRGDG